MQRWKYVLAVVVLGQFLPMNYATAEVKTKKTFHITVPPNTGPHKDLHIRFKEKINGLPKAKDSENCSTQFVDCSIDGSSLDLFTPVGGGSFSEGEIDDVRVELNGKFGPNSADEGVIQEIRFTPNGPTYTWALPAGRKAIADVAAGFTLAEYFDFSDPMNGKLTIYNPFIDFGKLYTLNDFSIFTNMPLSRCESDDWDVGLANRLVYSTSALVIAPGDSFTFNLGAIKSYTYALASITTLSVTDTILGGTIDYEYPQGYAQTTIPEPASWALMILGFGLVGALRRVQQRNARRVPTVAR